jgi:hypothetical protein
MFGTDFNKPWNLVRDQGVGGSNPLSPTNLFKQISSTSGFPSQRCGRFCRRPKPHSSIRGRSRGAPVLWKLARPAHFVVVTFSHWRCLLNSGQREFRAGRAPRQILAVCYPPHTAEAAEAVTKTRTVTKAIKIAVPRNPAFPAHRCSQIPIAQVRS